VKPSFRHILVDSCVGAAAVASLLLIGTEASFEALWPLVSRVVGSLFTAIAILDIPYFGRTLTLQDRGDLLNSGHFGSSAFISFVTASILSRWISRKGPLAFLRETCNRITGRDHA
jgi:hypothetical protein